MAKSFVSLERRRSNVLFTLAFLLLVVELVRLLGFGERYNGLDLIISIFIGFIVSRAIHYMRLADSLEHGAIFRARRAVVKGSR